MPPGEAEGRGEERGFIRCQRTHGVERGTGVGVRLHGGRDARLTVLQAEEEVGRGRGLPFKTAIRADSWKAVAPDQLPRFGGSGELGDALRIDAEQVRPIDPGTGEKRFRRQASSCL